MPSSPKERLERLQHLLREKEEKKKELAEAEKETEEELREAQEQIEAEIRELRRDEEIRELMDRMRGTSAMLDKQLLAEFERKGLGRPGGFRLPENEPDLASVTREREEQTLDDMLAGASGKKEEGAVLYAMQDVMQRQGDLYGATNSLMRQGLERVQEATRRGLGLTDNEYGILSKIEEEARRGMENPYYADNDPRKVYASQTAEMVDSIKQHMGLRVGDQYLRDDENWGY